MSLLATKRKSTDNGIRKDPVPRTAKRRRINIVDQLRRLRRIIDEDNVIEFAQSPELARVIGYLTSADPNIQFEAACIVINVAAGPEICSEALIKLNTVQFLIQHVYNASIRVKNESIWALGNIATGFTKGRDHMIRHGVIPALRTLLEAPEGGQQYNQTLIRTTCWTLARICSGEPRLSLEIIQPILPVFEWFIKNSNDVEIIVDTCTALSYVSYEHASILIELACSNIIDLLGTNNTRIISPALKIVGNIVHGTDEMTQRVVDCKVIQALGPLLNNPDSYIRFLTLWSISNIAAGTPQQKQALLQSGIIPHIIQCATNDLNKVATEAVWVIVNILKNANAEIIHYMVENGCLYAFKERINLDDSGVETTVACLGAITHILETDKRYTEKIEESSLLDIMNHILDLAVILDDTVVKLAKIIVDTYFN